MDCERASLGRVSLSFPDCGMRVILQPCGLRGRDLVGVGLGQFRAIAVGKDRARLWRRKGPTKAVGRRSGAGAGSPPKDGALAWLSDNVIVFVQRQQLGEAEVGDLDVCLALYQNITRCKVSVHAPAGTQVLHALRADRGYRPQAGAPPSLTWNPTSTQTPNLTPPLPHPGLQS